MKPVGLLCPQCRKDYDGWLDAPMLRPPPRFSNGAAYDDTPRGVMDNRRGRANEHWKLVRRQTELIKQICARKHSQSN